VEERMKALLDQMTIEEKIYQLYEQWGYPGVERLGIPPLYKSECVHGYSYGTGATIFPQAIALASTWDTDTVEKVGKVISKESKAANAYMAWTPVLDIARDMRWGRVEETYGEDTHLVTKIGMSWIKGYQTEGLSATPKHFAAHGAPLGGRDSHYVGYSERVLREVHFPPFREAVKSMKVQAIMSAYHFMNGIGCTASKELLTKQLREEWGFDGFVVTDVGAPENIVDKQYTAANARDAAVLMMKAGVDSCAPRDIYEKGLPQALEEGLITEEDINERVSNILRVKFRLGLFDREENPPLMWADVEEWDLPDHRAAALEAARKSIVLLKNDNNLLPLSKRIKKIALIGPAMKSQELGDYSCEPNEGQVVTIYEGICNKLGENVMINYAEGCPFIEKDLRGIEIAVKAAEASELVILAVGDKSNLTTGEGRDRADLDLTGSQNELIKAVAACGKPVVLLLACGKPATIEWAAENIPAIVMTWYSGEEGGNAIADVLFGYHNPGGRLPVTWPKSSSQLPLYYNYHLSGRGYDYIDMSFAPRYRFGYGLSYTSFYYDHLVITPEHSKDGKMRIKVDVTNTGKVPGEEVVQLYVTHMYPSVSTPITQLKGFDRIYLIPGETKTVTFELHPYELSILDLNMKRKVEAGEYKVMIGGVSPDCIHTTRLKSNLSYTSQADGISGLFHITEDNFAKLEYEVTTQDQSCEIVVKNTGILTDTGRIEIYLDQNKYADQWYEAESMDETFIRFTYSLAPGDHNLIIRDGDKIIINKILNILQS
jgi:beta-glucosidase